MKLLAAALLFLLLPVKDGKEAKKTDRQNTITILCAGLPGRDSYQQYAVARKYHFQLISLGGCLVAAELRDSMDRHNKIAMEQLNEINGPHWQDRYHRDVKLTYKRDLRMFASLKKKQSLVPQDSLEKALDNKLIYIVDSTLAKNVYRINIIGYRDGPGTFLASFYRVYMNAITMRVTGVDDKVDTLEIVKR